jgi:hypothetical protein
MLAIRLPIKKLSGSAVAPLATVPNFSSALLRSGATWPQDVNYLRDTYKDIQQLWERMKDPSQDRDLYEQTEPRLRELILGMTDVSKSLPDRRYLFESVRNAEWDFGNAHSHAAAQDYALATTYQSYALAKMHNMLDLLTREANKKKAAINKEAYGYDISGEAFEQGGTSGQDNQVRDLANPANNWETSKNKVDFINMVDAEAERDFPDLAEYKHKRIYWPARTR